MVFKEIAFNVDAKPGYMENKPDERPGHLTMARAGGPSLFAINGNNTTGTEAAERR